MTEICAAAAEAVADITAGASLAVGDAATDAPLEDATGR